jgi:hypothetical protein
MIWLAYDVHVCYRVAVGQQGMVHAIGMMQIFPSYLQGTRMYCLEQKGEQNRVNLRESCLGMRSSLVKSNRVQLQGQDHPLRLRSSSDKTALARSSRAGATAGSRSLDGDSDI